MLYHIVAVASNHVIGKNNQMPWHFTEDMKHFKKMTTGSTVIMGRKTYESLGKPLPERQNFVLSKTHPVGGENPRFFNTLGAALSEIKTQKAFIIGGEEIYRQTLPIVNGIYMTRIHGEYEGDAFYPQLPPNFSEKSRTKLREDPLVEVVYYENVQAKECKCCG